MRERTLRWFWAMLLVVLPLIGGAQLRPAVLWQLGSGGNPFAISVNGNRLFTQLDNYLYIAVWDLPAQRLIRTIFVPENARYRGHHLESLTASASPDGSRVGISLSQLIEGIRLVRFKVIDANAGLELWHRDFDPDTVAEAGLSCFSLDGQQVALMVVRSDGENRLLLLRASDGQLLQEYLVPFGVSAMRYLPNGRLIVSGVDLNWRVWIWDVFSEAPRPAQNLPAGARAFIQRLAPDGTYLLAAGDYPQDWYALFEVATGRLIRYEQPGFRITDIEFTSDADICLLAGFEQTPPYAGILQVRRISTGSIERTISPEVVDSILAHPLRPEVFVGGSIWNWATGQLVGYVGGVRSLPARVRFSADSQLVLIEEREQVRLHRAIDGQLRLLLPPFERVAQSALSPDGRFVAVASSEGLFVYTVPDGTLVLTRAGSVEAVAFSPDGRLMASMSPTETLLYSMPAATLLQSLPGDRGALVFSPDGRHLVAGHRIWQLPETNLVAMLHPSTTIAAFSPEGRWILSGSSEETCTEWYGCHMEGDLSLWRTDTWQNPGTVKTLGGVESITFLPNSTQVLVGLNQSWKWIEGGVVDGALIIYQLPDLQPSVLAGGALPAVARSATGRYLFTAHQNLEQDHGRVWARNWLTLWRVQSTEVQPRIRYEEGAFQEVGTPIEVDISPDEQLIAWVREEGVVVIARNPLFTPYGDVNEDGCVDDADLLSVLMAFGSAQPDADVNGDGVVDDADLLTVLFHFGSGC